MKPPKGGKPGRKRLVQDPLIDQLMPVHLVRQKSRFWPGYLACRPVLPQFHRLCPNLPFPSNHSERWRENGSGNVRFHGVNIV